MFKTIDSNKNKIWIKVLGIISAVLRDMPILFVQGNKHIQCYRRKLLWFYNNSSLMCGYCLRVCFWQLYSSYWELWPLICAYAVDVPHVFCPCKINVQFTCRGHFYTTQYTLYFLTFCRHILPPSTGWLNWSRWMLKWSGGRKFVVYVVRFEGIW
jgi:hypothetical protein